MKDYVTLQSDIDACHESIAEDGNLLDDALDAQEEAQALWDEFFDEFIAGLIEEYAGSTKRLPGEDVRLSLARQENREAWRTLQRADKNVKKVEKRLRRSDSTLDGLRSQLSAEKEQAKGAESYSGQSPQWSSGRA